MSDPALVGSELPTQITMAIFYHYFDKVTPYMPCKIAPDTAIWNDRIEDYAIYQNHLRLALTTQYIGQRVNEIATELEALPLFTAVRNVNIRSEPFATIAPYQQRFFDNVTGIDHNDEEDDALDLAFDWFSQQEFENTCEFYTRGDPHFTNNRIGNGPFVERMLTDISSNFHHKGAAYSLWNNRNLAEARKVLRDSTSNYNAPYDTGDSAYQYCQWLSCEINANEDLTQYRFPALPVYNHALGYLSSWEATYEPSPYESLDCFEHQKPYHRFAVFMQTPFQFFRFVDAWPLRCVPVTELLDTPCDVRASYPALCLTYAILDRIKLVAEQRSTASLDERCYVDYVELPIAHTGLVSDNLACVRLHIHGEGLALSDSELAWPLELLVETVNQDNERHALLSMLLTGCDTHQPVETDLVYQSQPDIQAFTRLQAIANAHQAPQWLDLTQPILDGGSTHARYSRWQCSDLVLRDCDPSISSFYLHTLLHCALDCFVLHLTQQRQQLSAYPNDQCARTALSVLPSQPDLVFIDIPGLAQTPQFAPIYQTPPMMQRNADSAHQTHPYLLFYTPPQYSQEDCPPHSFNASSLGRYLMQDVKPCYANTIDDWVKAFLYKRNAFVVPEPCRAEVFTHTILQQDDLDEALDILESISHGAPEVLTVDIDKGLRSQCIAHLMALSLSELDIDCDYSVEGYKSLDAGHILQSLGFLPSELPLLYLTERVVVPAWHFDDYMQQLMALDACTDDMLKSCIQFHLNHPMMADVAYVQKWALMLLDD